MVIDKVSIDVVASVGTGVVEVGSIIVVSIISVCSISIFVKNCISCSSALHLVSGKGVMLFLQVIVGDCIWGIVGSCVVTIISGIVISCCIAAARQISSAPFGSVWLCIFGKRKGKVAFKHAVMSLISQQITARSAVFGRVEGGVGGVGREVGAVVGRSMLGLPASLVLASRGGVNLIFFRLQEAA